MEVLRGDFGFPNSVKADSRGKRLGQSRGRAGVKLVLLVLIPRRLCIVEGVTANTADGKEQSCNFMLNLIVAIV